LATLIRVLLVLHQMEARS